MGNIVDLDALMPSPVTIKFGGKDIEVQPPKTSDILRLGVYAEALGKIEEMSTEEVTMAINNLNDQIGLCIPELKGINLNMAQMLKVVQIINDMAMPTDVKAMNESGVTAGDPKAPRA